MAPGRTGGNFRAEAQQWRPLPRRKKTREAGTHSTPPISRGKGEKYAFQWLVVWFLVRRRSKNKPPNPFETRILTRFSLLRSLSGPIPILSKVWGLAPLDFGPAPLRKRVKISGLSQVPPLFPLFFGSVPLSCLRSRRLRNADEETWPRSGNDRREGKRNGLCANCSWISPDWRQVEGKGKFGSGLSERR